MVSRRAVYSWSPPSSSNGSGGGGGGGNGDGGGVGGGVDLSRDEDRVLLELQNIFADLQVTREAPTMRPHAMPYAMP